ncbi:protein eyes shut [Condylostylus longicornis]|uniref:protein eyes shut n=1 Tax=Condylostylus longicornis TaxID=2530218 RepID=UPI00244E27B3|nr:protein eyes shut [Condylostylus longicornis]
MSTVANVQKITIDTKFLKGFDVQQIILRNFIEIKRACFINKHFEIVSIIHSLGTYTIAIKATVTDINCSKCNSTISNTVTKENNQTHLKLTHESFFNIQQNILFRINNRFVFYTSSFLILIVSPKIIYKMNQLKIQWEKQQQENYTNFSKLDTRIVQNQEEFEYDYRRRYHHNLTNLKPIKFIKVPECKLSDNCEEKEQQNLHQVYDKHQKVALLKQKNFENNENKRMKLSLPNNNTRNKLKSAAVVNIITKETTTKNSTIRTSVIKSVNGDNFFSKTIYLHKSWLFGFLLLLSLLQSGNAGFACLSNPCIFGVCIDGLNSSYSCYCIDGYTGVQCQTNWDECWSSPCINGGTCIDGVAYYNCTCPEGFSGANCQENVDECLSNPCQNGGTCKDRNNGYTCTCQPGYLGTHCEVDVAVCDTGTGARCHNGGECIEGPGLEFDCKCAPGWHGRICQHEINECESSPCQNGGVCVDKLASYVCACPMGYTGVNCEEEILICADNPCKNNALCLMEEGVPTCYCVPDFHGEKCEFQYDECQLGPKCTNGGVCIDGVDTFTCSCPPMLTGMLCECLMLDDDSLNCNYTMPSTTSVKPTTIATTVKITTIATQSTSISGGTTVVTERITKPPPPTIVTTARPMQKPVTITLSQPVNYSEESVDETTEAASVDSGEADYTSTSTSAEDHSWASEEDTTDSRFDKSENNGADTITEITSSKEPSYNGLPVTTQTSQTTLLYHPTTDKTVKYDLTSSRRPSWSSAGTTATPSITPIDSGSLLGEHTDVFPSIVKTTISTPSDKSSSSSSEEGYEVEEEITTSKVQYEIGMTTTIKPFFIDYPDVYVTTTYTKDLDGGPFTTYRTPFPPPTHTTVRPSVTALPPLVTTKPTLRPPRPSVSVENDIETTTIKIDSEENDILEPSSAHTDESYESGIVSDESVEAIATTTSTSTFTQQPTILIKPTTYPSHSVHRTTPTSFTQRTTLKPTQPTYKQTLTTFTSSILEQQTTKAPFSDNMFTLPTLTTTTPTIKHAILVSTTSPTISVPKTTPPDDSSINEGNYTVAPDCVKLGCFNGGTCVTTSEGSRCVCRFDRQGPLCESPVVIQNAAFSGDSYVSHRINKDIPNHESLEAVLPMHIQLKVRTRATNGLIMLAAAQGTKGGHYMALFLQKGLLQFQFSCGLQTMLLSELETPVNTGHEITIRAELDFSRNFTHCNASLLVNDTLTMSGDQPTWLKLLPNRMHIADLILNTWLHLGGAPQAPIGLIIELPPAQSGTGFTGCLHSLKINGEERDIFGDALDGFGITECGSLACLSSPCRNGAACIKIDTKEVDENGQKQEKWKCKCPSGYMGSTCETSVCEDNPCQYGGTCVQFPGSGYLCLCPLGKHGHYCEHNLEVALPSFSGSVNGLSSYVAYTVPIPLEYSLELSFKILPQTMSQISLLAFLGQSGYHDEKSDHLAVSFIQGYIMLTWNLGGGPRRIFTQKPIDFRLDAPRVPYEIKVGRIGRQAWLSVDGKFNITGRSPGSVTRMDVIPILYLGGHEIVNFNTLPHDLPLHSGFQGCIYDVSLKSGQVTVPLQETRGVRGRGVGQCGTRECHRHACQHDGACLQHGATFTCICQEGWYGPLCAQHVNPCDSFNNKCSEDSTCVPLVNGYECDCPIGKTGKNCDEEIQSLSDVSLTGRRSYLAVRWPYLNSERDKIGSKRSQIVAYRNFTKKVMPKPMAYSASPNQHFVMKLLNEVEKQRSFSPVPLMPRSVEEHHRVQFFFIEFQIRPLSERGLLLYFGTLNNNQDKKVGFVSLSLQGGVVEFRISGPNNHVTVVRSVRMLAIGEWHKIKMAQRGRWLTLWVEGSASSALAPSAEVLVEQDSLLYIGGLKDLSKLPNYAISGFPIPFRGCVRGLVVSGTRIVLNETNILESRNIRDCDGTACGGDSCEAGGHCWLDAKLQPHCICPEYAKGDRCEYSETCKLIPCKNNGRCLRSGRCSCPNGWGGFYCEIAMTKPSTPSFRGNSYLVLPPPRIPMKEKRKGLAMYSRPREFIQIKLNFSTIEPGGLILWSEHGNKFLGLGLEDGHLKIASDLLVNENSTMKIPAGGFVSDGGWHSCTIFADRGVIELNLDGQLVFSERTNTNFNFRTHKNRDPTITYEDEIYIAGFPNGEGVSARTKNRFMQPFKGCLQGISFGGDPNSEIKDFSPYQGENIGSCDLHDDVTNIF